jgi:hypothetical protein
LRAFGTRWRIRQTAQFGDERIVLATSGGQGEPSFAQRGLVAASSVWLRPLDIAAARSLTV